MSKVTLLHELMCGTDTIPHVLQCESHPFNQQINSVEFCAANDIRFMAYSPLGYGAFKRPGEITVLSDPTLKSIGDKHGRSIAQVRKTLGQKADGSRYQRWHLRGRPTLRFLKRPRNDARDSISIKTRPAIP